jgi:hypothetical protein
MGTRLRQDQRYRLHRWLDSMPPADVWGMTATALAAAASTELGATLTPRILERARIAIVPKPPKEPDVMVAVLTRLAVLEAKVSMLEGDETVEKLLGCAAVQAIATRELETRLDEHVRVPPVVVADADPEMDG